MQIFGRVVELGPLRLARVILEGKGVFLVPPIETDPGGGHCGGRRIRAVRRRIHDRLSGVGNPGRSLYRMRRGTSSPEDAYPGSGSGSGRAVVLYSSNERAPDSYRSRTQNNRRRPISSGKEFDMGASRRRCSPSEGRSGRGSSCSAREQRRRSYTGVPPVPAGVSPAASTRAPVTPPADRHFRSHPTRLRIRLKARPPLACSSNHVAHRREPAAADKPCKITRNWESFT